MAILGYCSLFNWKSKVYGICIIILSGRLKHLKRDVYLERRMYPQVPIRVEYRLTDFGHSCLQKLIELNEWAQKYKGYVMGNRKQVQKN